jgi:hypothetical protein
MKIPTAENEWGWVTRVGKGCYYWTSKEKSCNEYLEKLYNRKIVMTFAEFKDIYPIKISFYSEYYRKRI